MNEMLPRLLALGDDVDPGILLQFHRQQRGVAFCPRQFVARGFPGRPQLLGSASHSGFGSEPAIVVGNSMGAPPGGA